MEQITVDRPFVAVHSGVVELDAQQAATRRHALSAIEVRKDGSGFYQVRQTIQFKRGERFGYDGEVSKSGDLRDAEAERIAIAEAAKKSAEAAAAETERKVRAECDARLVSELEALNAEFDGVLDELQKSIVGVIGDRLQPEDLAAIAKLFTSARGLE